MNQGQISLQDKGEGCFAPNGKVAIKPYRMALGTAQLGMSYGIANTTGQPDLDEARQIIAGSYKAGVTFFDTAQAYGNSERMLGQCFQQLGIASDVKVISKVDAKRGADEIKLSVLRSLDALGVPKLWALLLHADSLLDQWHGPVGQAFKELKTIGLAERLGVSVYSPERAHQALKMPDIEVIQVPANVFDRRLKRVDFFRVAASLGKHVFIRSVYLQGLVLQEEARAPKFAWTAVRAFRDFCRQHELVASEFAVAYVRHLAPAAVLVIGAERPEQAAENCRLFAGAKTSDSLCEQWDRVWPEDVIELINPTLWPR